MSPHDPGTGDRLSRALRALSAKGASEDFTQRLLARLDEPRHPAPPRLAWTAAVVALLTVLGLAATLWLGGRTPSRREVRAQELRLEQQQLRQEIEALRTMVRQSEPVLYLGSSDEYDFLFDLRPLVASRHEAKATPATGGPPARPEPR